MADTGIRRGARPKSERSEFGGVDDGTSAVFGIAPREARLRSLHRADPPSLTPGHHASIQPKAQASHSSASLTNVFAGTSFQGCLARLSSLASALERQYPERPKPLLACGSLPVLTAC